MVTLSYETKSDQALIDQQLENGSNLLSNLKVYPLVDHINLFLLLNHLKSIKNYSYLMLHVFLIRVVLVSLTYSLWISCGLVSIPMIILKWSENRLEI